MNPDENTYRVFLRPLTVEDAATSCHWRNDAEVWKFTGNKPDRFITEEMEREWAAKVIADPTRLNYAICLKEDGRHIGNIYATDIQDGVGHIGNFIGDRSCWGKGYGTEAMALFRKVCKEHGLHQLKIGVRLCNTRNLRLMLKLGGQFQSDRFETLVMPLDDE